MNIPSVLASKMPRYCASSLFNASCLLWWIHSITLRKPVSSRCSIEPSCQSSTGTSGMLSVSSMTWSKSCKSVVGKAVFMRFSSFSRGVTVGRDETYTHGIECSLRPALHAEFAEDITDMSFDGFLTDLQAACDLLVGLALCKQP